MFGYSVKNSFTRVVDQSWWQYIYLYAKIKKFSLMKAYIQSLLKNLLYALTWYKIIINYIKVFPTNQLSMDTY